MTRAKKTPSTDQTHSARLDEETEAAIASYKRSKSHDPSARRRLVARLRANGQSVLDIVDALASTPATVWRDLAFLRREAAARQLAAEPEACSPLFLEEAEDVVRKVRQAQHDLADKEGTFYLNLLKLEWAMLVKLAEITRAEADKNDADASDEFADLSKCSNEELLEQARELGIDVTGFERALRFQPNEAA